MEFFEWKIEYTSKVLPGGIQLSYLLLTLGSFGDSLSIVRDWQRNKIQCQFECHGYWCAHAISSGCQLFGNPDGGGVDLCPICGLWRTPFCPIPPPSGWCKQPTPIGMPLSFFSRYSPRVGIFLCIWFEPNDSKCSESPFEGIFSTTKRL